MTNTENIVDLPVQIAVVTDQIINLPQKNKSNSENSDKESTYLLYKSKYLKAKKHYLINK